MFPRRACQAVADDALEIVDERTAEVFRLLVREGRPFNFLPGKGSLVEDDDGEEVIAELALPEDDGVDQRGFANREVGWSDISRGMKRERPGLTDEMQMRAFWRRWNQMMEAG